ncbi:MAG: hypothetical protein SW019_04180 [Actinomycetota bacterium]|nr:hypothetical protein [Actinomycetota bacterium]
MMRRAVIPGLTAAALLSGSAGVAAAGPVPPAPPCSFTLSAPQVVHRDGADVVTATVAPADCGPPASPYLSVACVQLVGDGAPKQCAQGRDGQPAQVFYAPFVPGAAYTATGRGCGNWIGNEPAPQCQQLGPHTVTP